MKAFSQLLYLSFMLCITAKLSAVEVVSFSVLTLTPKKVDEQFLMINLVLNQQDLESSYRVTASLRDHNGRNFPITRVQDQMRWSSELALNSETASEKIPLQAYAQLKLSEVGPLDETFEIFYQIEKTSPEGVSSIVAQTEIYRFEQLEGYRALVKTLPQDASPQKRSGKFDPRQSLTSDKEGSDGSRSKLVYFATNRTFHKIEDRVFKIENPSEKSAQILLSGFSSLQNEEPEMRTLFGSAVVKIPPRSPGAAIDPSNSTVMQAVRYFKTTGKEASRGFVAQEVESSQADRNAFHQSLKTNGPILIYVHGYNNDFETVIKTAAQLKSDLRWPGSVVAYSWPSRGNGLHYPTDLFNANRSVKIFSEFLAEMTHQHQGQRISVLAHSMGNHLFLQALDHAVNHQLISPGSFDRIILAAPDVEEEEFRTMGPHAVWAASHVTYYYSRHDFAVLSSKTVRLGLKNRAGLNYIPVAGMEAVDATPVTEYFEGFGHNYFCTVEAAVADISYSLTDQMKAELRENVTIQKKYSKSQETHWKLIAPDHD